MFLIVVIVLVKVAFVEGRVVGERRGRPSAIYLGHTQRGVLVVERNVGVVI